MITNISIIVDFDTIEQAIGKLSPFNLRRDCKSVSSKELKEICEELSDTIYKGNKPPTCTCLHRSRNNGRNICALKIRVSDPKSKKGKSGGYRCVILMDEEKQTGILLTLFRKVDRQDLTQIEKKNVCKLVEIYAKQQGEEND